MAAKQRATDPITIVDPKRTTNGGWYMRVAIDGVHYWVTQLRGRRVRIAYKPRGENTGYKWIGVVRHASGKEVWTGPVTKSTGYRWMLEQAGLVRMRPSELKKELDTLEHSVNGVRRKIVALTHRVLQEEHPIRRKFLVHNEVRRPLESAVRLLTELEAEYAALVERHAPPGTPTVVAPLRCRSWPKGDYTTDCQCLLPYGHALDCTDGNTTWPMSKGRIQ